MSKYLFVLILCIACTLNFQRTEFEFLKRDNLVYSDPFISEVICKINQDSFRLIEYQETFFGTISNGLIHQIGNNKYKLTVINESIISLNTGQILKQLFDVKNVCFELQKGQDSVYILTKKINNIVDSTFRSKPFKIINQLNYVEEWLMNEQAYSNKNKIQNVIPPPPEPPRNEDIKLKNEIDSLDNLRNHNMKTLISEIAIKCKVSKQEKVVVQIKLNPDGSISKFDIKKEQTEDISKLDCIEKQLSDPHLNLGYIKIIPNARNGSKPIPVVYTLPIYNYF